MSLDELRDLLERHWRPGGATALADVRICRGGNGASVLSGAVLAVVVEGEKRIALDDRVHDYRAGQYLIASADLPVAGHFQAVTAMTPIGFRTQLRLSAARLLPADRSDDVTGIGLRVGYDNPSRFSRDYRRRFGAPPSVDGARLRAGGVG